jgi:predicted nucleic acid-binding protein
MRAAPAHPGRRVLVDTSAYFALADANETRHPAADAVRRKLLIEHWRLVTTNYVVAETHALLLIRLGYAFAMRFLTQLDASSTVILRITEDDEIKAREILRQYDDKRFSLTDATSFAIMERSGIRHTFTFDHNFTQYGLTVLTADRS